MRKDNGLAISVLRRDNIEFGMLKGPVDLFKFREEMQEIISISSTGDKKKEKGLRS